MSTDREPQPGDGPDYHADHAYWLTRRADAEIPAGLCGVAGCCFLVGHLGEHTGGKL